MSQKAAKSREPRYPATSLVNEEESAAYWLDGYNHSLFKVMSRIDENVIAIKKDTEGIKGDIAEVKDDIAEVREDIEGVKTDMTAVKGELAGVKTDVAALAGSIEALTQLVKDGFSTLGINVANGDHRIGRPVK